MEKKGVAKLCGYFVFLVIILLLLPRLNSLYPDYQFFWGIAAGAAICLQIIFMASHRTGDKIKPGKLLTFSGKGSIPFSQIAAYLVSVFVLLALVGTITFAFISDQNIINRISSQSITVVVKAAIWFVMLIALIFIIIGCILYSVKLFKQVIESTFRNEGKIDIQDSSFLKLLSIFLLVILYTVIPDMGLTEWFNFMSEPNEIAPALKGIVVLVSILLLALVVYRILEAFVKSDSAFRKYVDQIFKILLDTVGESILALLYFVNKIPNMISMLSKIKIVDYVQKVWNFIMEEEEEIYEEKNQ